MPGTWPLRIGTVLVPLILISPLGASRWTTEFKIAPMSATLSTTVFWSRLKIARWASRTPRRNRLLKAPLPMMPDAAPSITGRAAIRSGCALDHAVGDPAAHLGLDLGLVERSRGVVGELVGVEEDVRRVAL